MRRDNLGFLFLIKSDGMTLKTELFVGVLAAALAVHGKSCKDLTQQEKREIADLVRRQFNFLPETQLYVSDTHDLPGGCYKRLSLSLLSGEQVAQDFYLSPDHRYLSLKVFDIKLYSPERERAQYERLREALSDQSTPTLGSKEAPVMISLFTDWQCPFCRDAENTLREQIRPRYGNKVVLAIHDFPLPDHPWAFSAATALRCIHTEQPEQFWPMADYVEEHQSAFSADTFIPLFTDRVSSRPALNLSVFRKCLESGEPLKVIANDQRLGRDLEITSTPTIFINGHRIEGAAGFGPLSQYIDEELAKIAK